MDERVVRRAQRGDQAAFEALILANHARLLRVAQGVLRDRHVAEDATQQVFLDIWRDIRRLRDASKFEGWSYRLLLRVCYAEARRQPKWVPDSQIPAAAEPRVGDVFGVVVDRDQLSWGFRHLSTDHRAVIVLRYLIDIVFPGSPREAGPQTWILDGEGAYQGLALLNVDGYDAHGYIIDGGLPIAPENASSK